MVPFQAATSGIVRRPARARFTCPFHAWSYDTAGTLVGLPKAAHFGDVDKECLGLIALPAEERHGLLFVNPDPDGDMDLDHLLGEWFNDEFSTWGFDKAEPLTSAEYDTACNWKLAMDTFGETYHFTTLHSDTLALNFHGNVQCYDEDGHLHRMILCKRAIDEMRLLSEDEWNITVAGLPRDEDYVMSASQQAAANSGALDEIVFGRNEPALHHYHNTYREMLGQEPLPLLDSIRS